ncbi:hypothetical protein Misp03_37000 [Microbispora sp. NBRC 16548]|nr:hypothetical protein Misp03_37000 [Microbispora sp. NBRC 16548]
MVVDQLAELADRFPVGSYVRHVETGWLGRIAAEPASSSPCPEPDATPRIAH